MFSKVDKNEYLDDEIIDLSELFCAILKHLKLLLILFAIFACCGFFWY